MPCVLELAATGTIVAPDADLNNVIDSVRWGIFFNAGQVCSAMSRMIVHRDVHDEMISRLEGLATSLSVGPGIERREFGANMGAMVSEKQRDRAIDLIQGAVSEGARLVTGGHKLNRPGWFLPTILDGVTTDRHYRRSIWSCLVCVDRQ